MKYFWVILFFVLFAKSINVYNVRTSFSNDQEGNPFLIIGYQTMNKSSTNLQYGSKSRYYIERLTGFSRSYDPQSGWNHFIKLPYLKFENVFYRVGEIGDWSKEYVLKNLKSGNDQKFSFVVLGDYGIDNSRDTTKTLISFNNQNKYEFVLHAGDISYANDYEDYERVWNTWFEDVQPVISNIPWQVSVGNHEVSCRTAYCINATEDFVDFKYKFEMAGNESGSNTNMFYSFNYQNVHFISISTETDYPNSPENYGNKKDQLEWLENDLKNANLPLNRQKRPFVIVYGHRPIYTGNEEKGGQPKGYSKELQISFESLFKRYNVDIFFAGHVHNYQRNYPIYNNTVVSNEYNNPNATIYIISGAAGQKEGLEKVRKANWLAHGEEEWGFGIVDVISNNQLVWTFYSSKTEKVLDKVVINKSNI
eukprot:TRINITY_DN1622_c0_g2_i1.p1 TRINITY_DN1622_c0_g2~~TRINITY_DN1622_c0_g2_i1.p1  ORF type:complete len:422 (+),score=100.11 TRINITY_DN1622_c0_g2_i1:404-1669(+)